MRIKREKFIAYCLAHRYCLTSTVFFPMENLVRMSATTHHLYDNHFLQSGDLFNARDFVSLLHLHPELVLNSWFESGPQYMLLK